MGCSLFLFDTGTLELDVEIVLFADWHVHVEFHPTGLWCLPRDRRARHVRQLAEAFGGGIAFGWKQRLHEADAIGVAFTLP